MTKDHPYRAEVWTPTELVCCSFASRLTRAPHRQAPEPLPAPAKRQTPNNTTRSLCQVCVEVQHILEWWGVVVNVFMK
jgi:hypothetical protein